MKVALCLSGTLGGIKGKSGEKTGGADRILHLAYPHFKKHILDINDVDVFVHSWDTHLADDIANVFRPKAHMFEEQKIFDIPEHLDNTQRVQNHFSRWYGVNKVVHLQKSYSEAYKVDYDMVMVSRMDLAWTTDVNFSDLDLNYFYVANWYQHHTSEPMGYPHGQYNRSLQDCWFIGNQENITEFANIYNDIPEYTEENPELAGYKGISNHRLAYYKLVKMGILPDKLRFKFRYDVPEKNDFPLIRWKYFNDKT